MELLGHIGPAAFLSGCDERQHSALLVALLNCTQHERWWVRRSVFECLGRLSVSFDGCTALESPCSGAVAMALGRKIIHTGVTDQNFLVR